MGHRRVGSGPESVVLEDTMELAIASHLMTAQAEKDPVRPESRHVHEYTQRSPDER
jgi:hypothetical protein